MSFLYRVMVEGIPGYSFGPVYHGGTWDGKKPIRVNGKGALGIGAYFTPNKAKAQEYHKGHLVAAYLNINNPLVIHASREHHPCVSALVTLGMNEQKASNLVEKIEERNGYMGSEIKNLAQKQGYDGIFEYFGDVLGEIVIWNPMQVKVIED